MAHTAVTRDGLHPGLHRAHTTFLETGVVPRWMRSVVAQSWLRSAAAGVDSDANLAPVGMERSVLDEYRSAHPLSQVFPVLYDVLGRAAEDCEALMAIGDVNGQLLWVCGRPAVLRKAERINFTEGALWDESHAGTNAPGMALQLDAPVQITAAEHFSRVVQPWSCAAAPIHDPRTGAILGLVDVTGGEAVSSPQTLGMVRAAARLAEAELARIAAIAGARRGEVSGECRSGSSTGLRSSRLQLAGPQAPVPEVRELRIRALGRLEAEIELVGAGTTLQLSPRHSELVLLLAQAPKGLTGEQLEVQLYVTDVHSSTLRAELTRLRGLLGADVLQSRPYRFTVPVACDWTDVHAAVAAGRVGDALSRFAGPLLPQSEAPGIVESREALERQLRAAVLSSGQPELMVAWTRSRWGADDQQMWQAQADALPAHSPLRAIAQAEADRLEVELLAYF